MSSSCMLTLHKTLQTLESNLIRSQYLGDLCFCLWFSVKCQLATAAGPSGVDLDIPPKSVWTLAGGVRLVWYMFSLIWSMPGLILEG